MLDPLIQLNLWKQLALPASKQLLDDAKAINPSDVAAISRLRKKYDADLLHLALDMVKARHKAASKWPVDIVQNLIANTTGIEQATSLLVSKHKAKRFVDLGQPVIDICCGIGGDALGLKQCGVQVTGVDIDPVHAWMTTHNANCPTQVIDANDVKIDRGSVFHIDPSRRNAYGRTQDISDYQPGPDVLKRLLAQQPTACFKLGPGVNLDCLKEEITGDIPNEIEIISEHGHLVQAVLWTGELAKCARRATLLPQGLEFAAHEDDVWEEPPLDEIGKYVMTFDPSVERLGLIALLCQKLDVSCVHPQAGLLTSDQITDSPWVHNFQVLADLPWRPKKLKAELRKQNAGIVEIKTRGKLVNPDPLQKQLRGKGDQLLTV
ncbi:MAG: hypothetical protein JKX85_06735, partial [Phycisphaeraceae bacterium]|nr:hypothetical protein [Phycisphaeraceae bacterium]